MADPSSGPDARGAIHGPGHGASPSGARGGLHALARSLDALDAEIADQAEMILAGWEGRLAGSPFQASARNLAFYLALRRADRTGLQARLRRHGLSTLGRSEGRVLATLRAIRATLAGRDPEPEDGAALDAPAAALARAAESLFGLGTPGRRTRIMATLEPDACAPEALDALLATGVEAVRINCAHDDPADWRRMAEAARAAAARRGGELRVYMDLAGPKIRTMAVLPQSGIRVRAGDHVVLRPTAEGARPRGARASAACTLPGVVDQIAVGAAVAFDDGKLAGVVRARDAEGLWVEITRTKPGGARLKPDKGINFSGSALDVPALTDADRAALDTAAELADLVGYSFVQRAADLDLLHRELDARGARAAVVAKIETEAAFRALPEIVVAGAARGPFGLMIARGDLAVEVGPARLSEVQEEILWLAEAARVPVIWATEVLASLVKGGLPARGDITDAAMGARAECVMLNKGRFQVEGAALLADLLARAERHVDKKTSQLPRLESWG